MKSTLKIIHISDTHNRHKQVKWPENFTQADVLIHSGDMSGIGRKSEVTAFLEWFSAIPIAHKILIAGNHDLCFDPERAGKMGIQEWLIEAMAKYQENDHHFYLEDSSVTIQGVNFWGSPITPWFHGERWAFNRFRGGEINIHWKKVPANTDVLITHGPPMYKNDYAEYDKEYVGCEGLAFCIEKHKPLISLAGHIHEGYGYVYDKDTHYFNGSICNLQYEPLNAPWFIEANFEEREIKILKHESKNLEDGKS